VFHNNHIFIMKRKLTLIEGTMYAGGKTPVNVVAGIKIKGIIYEKNLLIATTKIQERHPLLKVNVLEDEKTGIPYFVKQNPIQNIPIHVLERITDDDWKKESITQCLIPFEVKNTPLVRLVWLKSSVISELIFVAHHCICDGMSILNLIDETLLLLDNPCAEIGTYSSFSSISEFIPKPIINKKINTLKVFLFSKLAELLFLTTARKREITRKSPYLVHWKLDRENSTSILQRCKEKGVSVNAILCAAFVQAFRSTESIKSFSKLYCAVDTRKFIPQIKSDTMFAFPILIALNTRNNKKTNLWDQAQWLKEELLTKINKFNISNLLMFSECLMPLLPKMTKYAKDDRGSHDFTLSNMGNVKLKENYGSIEVEALYSPATIFPFGNPSTLSITTFRGQVDFIFTSDESFIKYDVAVLLKDNAMKFLKSAID
jgi:NRPS condensation-like uncharacterized protein